MDCGKSNSPIFYDKVMIWILCSCLAWSTLNAFSIINPVQKFVQHKSCPTVKGTSGVKTALHSFGDPDGSEESQLLRQWQDFARNFDAWWYPDETDIPGLTFPSPVEWAPWMETIWFGNYYDYRTAFFQDVMYSNNQPCREGAVLFQNRQQALQVALLYQRYKKFDEASYGTSNATFYNLFGMESMRIGRYKVPQTDEVLLCTTDPLTMTEMKRYLTSFNPLKYFKSQFFQQKRKRQYPMRVLRASDCKKNKKNRLFYPDEFFPAAVHHIEFGRLVKTDPFIKQHPIYSKTCDYVIPVRPTVLNTTQCIRPFALSDIDEEEELKGEDLEEASTLVIPLLMANSQYLLENLWQSMLDVVVAATRDDSSNSIKEEREYDFGGLHILVGGDGRLLNSFAVEVLLRVAAANHVGRISLAKDLLLSTSAASGHLVSTVPIDTGTKRGRDAGTGTSSSSDRRIAIVLTAPQEAAGIRGSIGVNILTAPTQATGSSPSGPCATSGDAVIRRSMWMRILSKMSCRESVRITPERPVDAVLSLLSTPSPAPSAAAADPEASRRTGSSSSGSVSGSTAMEVQTHGKTKIHVFRPAGAYRKQVQKAFDFTLIREYLEATDLIVTIDCMNGGTSRYISPLLRKLGLEKDEVMFNSAPQSDFGGLVPRASAFEATDSMELFQAKAVSPAVAATEVELVSSEEATNSAAEVGTVIDVEEIRSTSVTAASTTRVDTAINTSATTVVTATGQEQQQPLEEEDLTGFGKETMIPNKDLEQQQDQEKDLDNQKASLVGGNRQTETTPAITNKELPAPEEQEAEAEVDNADVPDVGFALDADNRESLILFPGGYLSGEEKRRLVRLHSHVKAMSALVAPISSNAGGTSNGTINGTSTSTSTNSESSLSTGNFSRGRSQQQMDGVSTILLTLELLAVLHRDADKLKALWLLEDGAVATGTDIRKTVGTTTTTTSASADSDNLVAVDEMNQLLYDVLHHNSNNTSTSASSVNKRRMKKKGRTHSSSIDLPSIVAVMRGELGQL